MDIRKKLNAPKADQGIPCIVVDNFSILQSSGIEPVGVKDDNTPAL